MFGHGHNHERTIIKQNGGTGVAYFLGFIGAIIYYLNKAHGAGAVATAILKSFVWPAYFVYHLLLFVKA